MEQQMPISWLSGHERPGPSAYSRLGQVQILAVVVAGDQGAGAALAVAGHAPQLVIGQAVTAVAMAERPRHWSGGDDRSPTEGPAQPDSWR